MTVNCFAFVTKSFMVLKKNIKGVFLMGFFEFWFSLCGGGGRDYFGLSLCCHI